MSKILIFISFIVFGSAIVANSSSIDFSNKSITDDEIASAIRFPMPASISTITNWLDRMVKNGIFVSSDKAVTKLDLSKNNITLTGATQLFDYVSQNLAYLEEIDLSCNRIRDERGNEEYEKFEEALRSLLKSSRFQTLNLKINYLGMDWYRYATSKLSDELVEKIYWH